MALIICPECGQQISDKASECLKCGCPQSLFKVIDQSISNEFVLESNKEDPNSASLPELELKDNTSGLLIIDAAETTCLASRVNVSIEGVKIAKISDVVKFGIPIQRDCEVEFNWINGFNKQRIQAKANEIKLVKMEYGWATLQLNETIISDRSSVEAVTVIDFDIENKSQPIAINQNFPSKKYIAPVLSLVLSILLGLLLIVPIKSCIDKQYEPSNYGSSAFSSNLDAIRIIDGKSLSTPMGSIHVDMWKGYSGGEEVGYFTIESLNPNKAIIGFCWLYGGSSMYKWEVTPTGDIRRITE